MKTQLDLGLDLEPSNEHVARQWADEAIADGDFTNWDHAYEAAWSLIDSGDMFI